MSLASHFPRCCAIVGLCVHLGCDRSATDIPAKRPRPVRTAILKERQTPGGSLVAASVGSWKTERIGFEVGGRVEFVVEQNTEVEGRIVAKDGKQISTGTPVARIESERFELNVALADGEVARAQQDLVVAETSLNETIPAQIEAANARAELARAEYARQRRLMDRNAGSRGE
ncbi:MAG: hemolysin D, partial [Planctomycetota bacterium]